ncbi:hypothetical protein evm_015592, partial [Chilo suppressalis]
MLRHVHDHGLPGGQVLQIISERRNICKLLHLPAQAGSSTVLMMIRLEVLQIISERSNICKLLHLPAQSGSSAVLQRMRRGYTRDAYLSLVEHARSTIPG